MKKLLITLCGIVMLSGLSNFAHAEDKCHPDKFSPEMKAKMEQRKAEFEKRLNLTQEQKDKMKAIHEASRDQIKPLFESLKSEREKLNQLKSSGASEQEIQAEQQKAGIIRDSIKTIRKSNFEQTQAILTPAQQKEFNKMHEERKKFRNHKNKFEEKDNKN